MKAVGSPSLQLFDVAVLAKGCDDASMESGPQLAAAGEDGLLAISPETVQRVGTGTPCPTPEGAGVAYVCPRDGTRVVLPASCHNWFCPTHVKVNAWRAAGRAADYLAGVQLRYALDPPIHVVYAPPLIRVRSKEDMEAMLSDAWRLLEGAGYVAAAMIFHPERHGGSCSWREGPHVHSLAFEPAEPEGLNAFFVGVIVKRVGMRRGVRGTLSYLLDHAGFVPGGQIVRYRGWASRNCARVPEPPRRDYEAPDCPLCGEPMVRELVLDKTEPWGAKVAGVFIRPPPD